MSLARNLVGVARGFRVRASAAHSVLRFVWDCGSFMRGIRFRVRLCVDWCVGRSPLRLWRLLVSLLRFVATRRAFARCLLRRPAFKGAQLWLCVFTLAAPKVAVQ